MHKATANGCLGRDPEMRGTGSDDVEPAEPGVSVAASRTRNNAAGPSPSLEGMPRFRPALECPKLNRPIGNPAAMNRAVCGSKGDVA